MDKLTKDRAQILADREARTKAKRDNAKEKKAPLEGRCHFFLQQKRRYCKFEQSKGSMFCVVHVAEVAAKNGASPGGSDPTGSDATLGDTLITPQSALGSDQVCEPVTIQPCSTTGHCMRERIPCPLDPNHTIYKDQLHSHLKKCTKASQTAFTTAQPCYKKDVNFIDNIKDNQDSDLLRKWFTWTPWNATGENTGNPLERARYSFAHFGAGQEFLDQLLAESEVNDIQTNAREQKHDGHVDVSSGAETPGAPPNRLKTSDTENMEHDVPRAIDDEIAEHDVPKPPRVDVYKWGPVVAMAFQKAVQMTLELDESNISGSGLDAAKLLALGRRRKTTNKDTPNQTAESLSETVSVEIAKGLNQSEEAQRNKHHLQNKLILQGLLKYGTLTNLPPVNLFLEYGCGKAALSRWLKVAMKQRLQDIPQDSYYLMVEREPRRNKAENKSRKEEGTFQDGKNQSLDGDDLIRLRLDIADFELGTPDGEGLLGKKPIEFGDTHQGPLLGRQKEDLNRLYTQVEGVRRKTKESAKSCVIVHAKHLCGGATDLALSSLAVTHSDSSMRERFPCKIGIATCCHHRCDTRTYVGFPLLSQALGQGCVDEFECTEIPTDNASVDPKLAEAAESEESFTLQQLFDVLVGISGWAVGGTGRDVSTAEDLRLLRTKKHLGVMAKRLLDLGRLQFCKSVLSCREIDLTNYCDDALSPENGFVLAK